MIHHRLTGEQSLTKHKLPASLFERQEGPLQREPLVSDQMLFSCPVAVNKQRTARLHTRTHSLGGRVGCVSFIAAQSIICSNFLQLADQKMYDQSLLFLYT